MKPLLRPMLVALAVVLAGIAVSVSDHAWASNDLRLTGRVVDAANILSPAAEAELTRKLEGLETQTRHQLVVATVPSLGGKEIEEFSNDLYRAWALGGAKENDGALFVVAPRERKVRIEVGYGLEGVMTDALSSVILQTRVLPRFKAGDMEGGVVSGTDAIIEQLALPDEQAEARVTEAAKPVIRPKARDAGAALGGLAPFIIFLVVMSLIFGRRGRRRGGLGGALPWIVLGALSNSRGGGGWSGGGGGGWSGGGGFSGGGGSSGGGGASGSW